MYTHYVWSARWFLYVLFVFSWVQRLLPTFMALRLDFAATNRRFAVLGLTSNMFVNKNSDLLALGFLTGVDGIFKLGLLSVNPSVVDSRAASRISLRFCWSSHLQACCYIFLMLFIHLCSKEDLVNDDWSIPIVFIWSSRRDDCSIHLITTHCCSNVSIDSMESMALFNNLDLTHWAAQGDLLFIWKHKYSSPTGGNYVVFVNSTGGIGKEVINGVKKGGVDVAWTLVFCFQGVTQDCISSLFKISEVFWIVVLSLFSSWDDIIVCDKLVVYDVWFAEDDNTGFLSVGVGIFDWLYL